VHDDGVTGVLAFRGDGSRHGFRVAVLALQPEGLVQVGRLQKAFNVFNCGASRRRLRERADSVAAAERALRTVRCLR